MGEEVRPWPVVCAIDFGTTYSGFAYSMRTDYERNPLEIKSNPVWFNEEAGTLKTPTCILFDKSGKFHSFGYDAERKYASLAEEAQSEQNDDVRDEEVNSSEDEMRKDRTTEDGYNDWLFFRRFKMELYKGSGRIRNQKLKNLKLEAENGKKLPALKVFAEAIFFLKKKFEDLLEKTTLRQENFTSTQVKSEMTHREKGVEKEDLSWSTDILWVLTVPAIWSDEGKQFMREAALQVGIKDEHLVLALEPESAALLCKQLTLTKETYAINTKAFEPGKKFMVVDCGGGTVDVTAYEVKSNGNLQELHCASGDAVGGTNVDELFVKLMKDIFGEDVINKLKKKAPYDWLELLRSFETKKRGMGKRNLQEENTVQITFSNMGVLFSIFEKANKKSVSSHLIEIGLKGKVSTRSKFAKLSFSENYLMESVFDSPIKKVVQHLNDLFKNKDVAEIDTVLLVGGFSECPLVLNAVKNQFPDRKVINPTDGSIAVMKGAVLFGHSPEGRMRRFLKEGRHLPDIQGIIRKSTAYYGIATDVLFIEGEHPESHKFYKEGGEIVCTDLFHCLIKKNQELEMGRPTIEKIFLSSTSCLANVEIYRSNDDVKYCTDESCTKIGEYPVEFSKDFIPKGLRKFKIQLYLGLTEQIIVAKDLTTDRIWKVNCDSLNELKPPKQGLQSLSRFQ
ncbi:heat shock 70 kDa protein 12A-like [Saccostrea cucullata]|uniref:heat shock 70 kDa protein 12A-like n=1 Tax=Saccostrea cuccullata TaxID=36930 RepID=UPI002ECFB85D